MDPGPLLSSLFVSSIGYVAFSYGKRQRRAPQLLLGLTLLFFPYFVDSALLILLIAAVLCLVTWLATRLGW